MKTLSMAYTTYKASSEHESMLFSVLLNLSDDEVDGAAVAIISDSPRAPTPADIKRAALNVRAEKARTEHTGPQGQYIEYWQRSPKDRAEIDVARAEFHRVWTALERGVPVTELYPHDSEPCQLARRLQAIRDIGDLGAVFAAPEEPKGREFDW